MFEWLFVVGLFLFVWMWVDRGCQAWERILESDKAVYLLQSKRSRIKCAQPIQTEKAIDNRSSNVASALSGPQVQPMPAPRSQVSASGGSRAGVTKGETLSSYHHTASRDGKSNGLGDPKSTSYTTPDGARPVPAPVGRRNHFSGNQNHYQQERVLRIP